MPEENILTQSPQSQVGAQGIQTTDDLFKELTRQAFGNADIVSSADTGVEKAIKGAQEATIAAQKAGEQRLERQFGEQITTTRKAGAAAITTAREAQRGFGVNRAALQQLNEVTDKKIKDLEQMKQDALLANNTTFASQLANLQLKELEFQQNAQQQSFNNLMSLGALNLQQSTEERLNRQFTSNLEFQKQTQIFNERKIVTGIATEFGVTIEDGETLESIVAKVAPTASKIKQAELNRLLKDSQDVNTGFTLTQTMTKALLDGATPEEAARVGINAVVAETNIQPTAKDLEEARRNAVSLLEDINARKAEEEVKETTQGTSFMTNVVNVITGKSQDRRELDKSIVEQTQRIRRMERFGVSKENIDSAEKKLRELRSASVELMLQERVKDDEGAFFNDLFGG